MYMGNVTTPTLLMTGSLDPSMTVARNNLAWALREAGASQRQP